MSRMICDTAERLKASRSTEIHSLANEQECWQIIRTCLVKQFAQPSWGSNSSCYLRSLEVVDMLRKLEMLREQFRHFSAFVTPQSLILKHSCHICYSEGCSGDIYEGRSTIGFGTLQ